MKHFMVQYKIDFYLNLVVELFQYHKK